MCNWPSTVMFIYTQLYFNNLVNCLIRDWRIDQVISLKYHLRSAIAPVIFAKCAGASTIQCTLYIFVWCAMRNLHVVIFEGKFIVYKSYYSLLTYLVGIDNFGLNFNYIYRNIVI